MLAPVLARLSELPGVADARVECSGTYFLLEGRDAAALGRALPAIRDVLGPSARLVEGDARAAQLAARPRGEPWFSAKEIRAVSYVEGRILATRMTDAVSAIFGAGDRERVHEATRVEIFAALERVHDEGGRSSSGWFWEEWPAIVDRVLVRLHGLGAPQLEAAERTLRSQRDGA